VTRVLFSSAIGEGHLNPMLPLADAFVRAGHDVAVAAEPAHSTRLAARGLEHLATPLTFGEREAQAEALRRRLRDVPRAQWRRVVYPHLFGEIEAPLKLPVLRDAIASWRPDLLVHDSADLAAPIAAAGAGVETVHPSFGCAIPLDVVQAAANATAHLWPGEPEPLCGLYRGVYLDLAPPSLQPHGVPGATRVQPLRPEPVAATTDERAPEWLDRLPERPVVYVTLGTLHNDPAVFRVLLDAFAPLDCNVAVTVGRNNDPLELAPLPANAIVERYVSQSLLLPRCDVVVSHGGSGSTLAALAHALPMLLCPRGADQFDNADACVAAGVARALAPEELTTASARAALETLLSKDSYRARSAVVADEIAAMPSADEAAAVLLAG
jgi:UDP:flavonoid glycosyltransferase YjiC (YdhE family)